MFYCDTSALVKTILLESESTELRSFFGETEPLVVSAIARTELPRAVLRRAPEARRQVEARLDELTMVDLHAELLERAGHISPPHLGSLDAIHLASALILRSQLTAFISYDRRLLDAASALGLPVASPGA